MREVGTWRKPYVEELNAQEEEYGVLSMPPTTLLDTELVLTVMKEYFPGQDPELAWAVLNGYKFPAMEILSEDAKKAICLARLHLPWIMSRGIWRRHLRDYRAVSPPYPLYLVHGSSVTDQSNVILSRRKDTIKEVLSTPPMWKLRPTRYARPGRYYFYQKRERHEVEIPGRAASLATYPVPMLAPPGKTKREAIEISLDALEEEAQWMDRVLKEQHEQGNIPWLADAFNKSEAGLSWADRIRNIKLSLIQTTGLQPSRTLYLDKLLHMIGMVASGKSSLLTVITVYLAHHAKGYRVTLVQSDVAALLRLLELFDALRLAAPELLAVPLIGRSTRLVHLNRLHAAEAERRGASLSLNHPAYQMLSPICPLDGLRQDTDPIAPGAEPCTSLYALQKSEDEETSNRKDCPLTPRCPVHLPTRYLAEARIWLATPASLLASGPQQPLVQENVRNIELVIRHADVVLIDEADLVQVQFDDRFAPMEVLVSNGNESWLDRLAVQVPRQVYRPGRPLIGRQPTLDRWLIAHDNTQRAVNRLYILLRESRATRKWLGQTYFSGDRLTARIASRMAPYDIAPEAFKQLVQKFAASPLVNLAKSDNPPQEWYTAIHHELLESDTPAALRELLSWLRESLTASTKQDPRKQEELAHYLLVTLIVAVLDHALQDMIDGWSATEALDLDRGSGGLFYHPSDDLIRLVPEPPMGAVLGFQYYDTKSNGNGQLRFFHIRGLGRSLLYHIYDALLQSDDIEGPHVLLTSGTSWAPGSWKYNIPVPPKAVLLPQQPRGYTAQPSQDKQKPSAQIFCSFDPQPDPDTPDRCLHVSGIDNVEERVAQLNAMVRSLTQPQGFGKPSALEKELNELEEHRQRILLVVGSYDEAKAVGETLAAQLMTRSEEHLSGNLGWLKANSSHEGKSGLALGDVLVLVSDSADEDPELYLAGTLRRSLLEHLPKHPARFLVAPLQSIERGHNILVGEEAAIGSVYFLVRPYPVPGDIHAAINKINTWATDCVPTLTQMNATLAGQHLRETAAEQWDKILSGDVPYKELTEDERTPLLWTQFVLVWQCIGRLLRGGVSARVHFVDAKWAEGTVAYKADTEASSMLVGFRRILRDALDKSSLEDREIARLLYGAAGDAFNQVEGVHYA